MKLSTSNIISKYKAQSLKGVRLHRNIIRLWDSKHKTMRTMIQCSGSKEGLMLNRKVSWKIKLNSKMFRLITRAVKILNWWILSQMRLIRCKMEIKGQLKLLKTHKISKVFIIISKSQKSHKCHWLKTAKS